MPFFHNSVCGLTYIFQELGPFGVPRDHVSFPVPVPLKSVKVDVKVVNFTAEVTITQNFVNCEAAPIECLYHFPVEEEAAVTDFTAQLEGRTIRTEVKEKVEARADYDRAVANHQTAVLLEEIKQDIFQVRVGQLSPGAGCEVRLTYLTELPVEEKRTRLTLPTTVAPRFIPASDDSAEARKIASIKHDFHSPVKMSLSLAVVMQSEILSITSPSHQIQVTERARHHDYHLHTARLESTTAAMDRDLIVLIESDQPCQPKVMVERNDDGSLLAMLTLVPDFQLRDQPIEAVFLVDCSGSMAGQSMNLAREALLVFLHSLPASSYFNVFIFGSRHQSLFPDSRRYDDDNLREAKVSCEGISANLGGTEVFTPLKTILQQPVKVGLARQVFVLTDGQVSNSVDCIELVRQHCSNNRLFTLGIGSSADRHLVKGLARAGEGTAVFTSQGEEITPKVMTQLKNAMQPCISDVKLKWPHSQEFEGGQENFNVEIETKKTLFGYGKPKSHTKVSVKSQVPTKVPPIYDGNRLVVYKLLEESVGRKQEISLRARTCEGVLEVSVPVSTESFIQGNSLHQLFARKLIQELEEKPPQDCGEDTAMLITELGLKYKLASKFTSFVGVDDKQNWSSGVMKTRQVANQIPAGGFGFGGSGGGTKHFSGFAGFGASPGGAPPAPPPAFSASARHQSWVCDGDRSRAMFGAARPTFGFGSTATAAPTPAFGFPNTGGSSLSNNQSKPPGGVPSGSSVFGSKSTEGFGSSTFAAFSQDRKSREQDSTLFGSAQPPGGTARSSSSTFSFSSDSSKTHSRSNSLRLTLCQKADGSFPADQDTVALLGWPDLEELLDQGRAVSVEPEVWVTLCCVLHLREKCQSERESWQLVAEKAIKWLQSRGVSDSAEEKAKQLMRETSERRKMFCPAGHSLSPVPGEGTEQQPWFCDAGVKCAGGPERGAQPWRCQHDWRVKQGGLCDFDICSVCVTAQTRAT